MAKRTSSKKATVVQHQEQPAKREAGSEKMIIGAVFIILALISLFEITGIMKFNFRSAKKPLLLAHWTPASGYTGLTSMYVYGNNVFFVDSTRGTASEYDVMTGKLINKYTQKGGVLSAVQLSNGNVLLLSPGNAVTRYENGPDNPDPLVILDGCKGANSIAVDPKDNVYAADMAGNLIIKYDSNLKKLSQFGKNDLKGPKQAYIGPNNTVYVLDVEPQGRLVIDIFNENGSLKKKFKVLESKTLFGFEGLAITPSGDVYVNSMNENAIHAFDANGNRLGDFSTSASNAAIAHTAGIAGGMDGKFVIPAYEILVLQDIKY
jgi:outer membrane protein assembly factor BamB